MFLSLLLKLSWLDFVDKRHYLTDAFRGDSLLSWGFMVSLEDWMTVLTWV